MLHDRLVETQHERGLAFDPVAGVHGATEFALHRVDARFGARHAGGADDVQAVLKVHQHLNAAGSAEGVAVQCHTLCGAEFDAHAVVGERDGVVAGPGPLGGLVVAAGEVGGLGAPAHACSRLQQHVTQFRDAGAADVGVGEAQDAWRPVLVPAAVVGASVGVVGAGRDHAEGHAGPWEGMADAIGSDEGVDIPGRRQRLGLAGHGQQRQQQTHHDAGRPGRGDPEPHAGRDDERGQWHGAVASRCGKPTGCAPPSDIGRCGHTDRPRSDCRRPIA